MVDETYDGDDGRFPFPAAGFGAPPRAYAERRARGAVAPVRLPSGDEVLLATAYEDVRTVLSDARFTRNLCHEDAPRLLPGPDSGADPHALTSMDPPAHTRLRRLVQGAFTPRRAQEWEPRVRAVTEELLDGIVAAGPPADFVAEFAFPLPVEVICRLLGVPAADSALFRTWSDSFLSLSAADGARRAEHAAAFRAYIDALVAEHRARPGEDLVDELIAARDEGDRLTEEELARMVRGLIVAGHETTANVLARGLLTLLRHPDQLAALRDDTADEEPARLPGAVEEILRTQVPGHGGLLRVATEDVVLPSGATIRAGQGVMAPVAAANHDPEPFAEPDAFDIRRGSETRHLAFGHGPHYCLGANLARVEVRVALGTVLRRLPGLALTAARPEELEWTADSRVCGLKALPLTW
ncbi:cytochrome P450 [Streptomyces albiaxialis]|uniref:Cytochrome P450 n=1 Tax=Streptomyces albiaxialis TaxID=329523 RepID=A0ABN2VQG6_9ACTN